MILILVTHSYFRFVTAVHGSLIYIAYITVGKLTAEAIIKTVTRPAKKTKIFLREARNAQTRKMFNEDCKKYCYSFILVLLRGLTYCSYSSLQVSNSTP